MGPLKPEAPPVHRAALVVILPRQLGAPRRASPMGALRLCLWPWRHFRVARIAAWISVLAFYGASAPGGHAQDIERWRPLVSEASMRFGIPAAWIEQVMRAESAGQVTMDGQPIRSTKGAIGLMQLMPATWREMRARLDLGSDPDAPRDNVLAGTGYLRLLYDRYGYPGLFAAYNAGPGRYERYLAGTPLPAETRAYLVRVVGRPGRAQDTGLPPGAPAGLTLGGTNRATSGPMNGQMAGVTRASQAAAIPPAAGLVSGPGQDVREGASLFVPPSGTLRPNGSSEDDGPRAALDPLFSIRRQRGSDGAP